jgi:serine/threonine protein kinase
MELSIRLPKVLRRDPEFIFSRGLIGDGSPVLVVSLAAEYPRPESLEHLEHEYSFREELDASWAARPFAVDRQSENIRLLLEDPGGTPLDQLLDDRSDLAGLLRLAIGLCGAIDHLHRRGIIHKDIKPANVLADPVTGRCWLTGFGLARRKKAAR